MDLSVESQIETTKNQQEVEYRHTKKIKRWRVRRVGGGVDWSPTTNSHCRISRRWRMERRPLFGRKSSVSSDKREWTIPFDRRHTYNKGHATTETWIACDNSKLGMRVNTRCIPTAGTWSKRACLDRLATQQPDGQARQLSSTCRLSGQSKDGPELPTSRGEATGQRVRSQRWPIIERGFMSRG